MMNLSHRSKEEADMGEMLTIEEIEARFAPQWVLINEPKVDDQCRVVGGVVLGSGPDGDELYRKATELGLNRIAVRYLGPWPEDMEFVL